MITDADLRQAINGAGFPIKKRDVAAGIITMGLEQFREYEKNWYYSHTGKRIKKPGPTHKTKIGRYDQKEARTILISALCRAWMEGTGEAPTLNNKKDYDSAFFKFAQRVLALEGIGDIHAHLEEYWSIRKKTAEKGLNIKKGRLSQGSSTS
jgi:hypothetical protein